MERTFEAIFGKDYRLSYSAFKELQKSVDHFIMYRTHPREQTEAMLFGSAFHCAILEPDEFPNRYMLKPEEPSFQGKSKNQPITIAEQKKAWLDSFPKDKKMITEEQHARLQAMYRSVYSHPVARKMLADSGAKKELQVEFDYVLDGTVCPMKGHIDFVGSKPVTIYDQAFENYFFDLKTTNDITNDGCLRAITNNKYYIQIAMYALGLMQTTGKYHEPLFVFVENVAPYAVNVVSLPLLAGNNASAWLDTAMSEINHELKKLQHWKENPNCFTGVSSVVTNIDMPNYVKYKLSNPGASDNHDYREVFNLTEEPKLLRDDVARELEQANIRMEIKETEETYEAKDAALKVGEVEVKETNMTVETIADSVGGFVDNSTIIEEPEIEFEAELAPKPVLRNGVTLLDPEIEVNANITNPEPIKQKSWDAGEHYTALIQELQKKGLDAEHKKQVVEFIEGKEDKPKQKLSSDEWKIWRTQIEAWSNEQLAAALTFNEADTRKLDEIIEKAKEHEVEEEVIPVADSISPHITVSMQNKMRDALHAVLGRKIEYRNDGSFDLEKDIIDIYDKVGIHLLDTIQDKKTFAQKLKAIQKLNEPGF